jgi:predicted transposase/invertase (TIGR01784 family)
MYDRTLKAKRDWNNMLSYAKEQAKENGKQEGIDIGMVKGKEEGKIEGKIEIAIAMLNKGMDMNSISEITQLSIDEIQKLMHK